MKKNIKKTTPMEKLQDIHGRLELFCESLAISIEKNPEDQLLRGQYLAYCVAKLLVEQSVTRGEIWKGGYVDNVGVVYEDQVLKTVEDQRKAYIDRLKEQANEEQTPA